MIDHPRTGASVLSGVFTAAITPFTKEGALDGLTFRNYCHWQSLAQVAGLVLLTPIGERTSLTTGEREELIVIAAEAAREATFGASMLVVVCIAAPDRASAIAEARRAAAFGAAAALLEGPTDEPGNGRIRSEYVVAVADAGDLPVVISNASGSGNRIQTKRVLELAAHPRIVGVTESASAPADEIAALLRGRPPTLAVLAHDDIAMATLLALGADGVISIASNESPSDTAALSAAFRANDPDHAARYEARWRRIVEVNRQTGGAATVKTALAMMGLLAADSVRGPLRSLSHEERSELKAMLVRLGLVEMPGGRMKSLGPINTTSPGGPAGPVRALRPVGGGRGRGRHPQS